MHGIPRGHLNYYILSKAGIFIAILHRKMTRISQPLHIVGNPRDYQQQLYVIVNMSSMRLSSSATAEKSFQVTEISDNLEIAGDSLSRVTVEICDFSQSQNKVIVRNCKTALIVVG